jgi:hypothetical protein
MWFDPREDKQNYAKIANLLQHFKKTIPGLKYSPHETNPTLKLVDTPVLIRADKWTEWHYVGEVMKQCSQPQAAFWKVELAMSEKDKEEKLLQRN